MTYQTAITQKGQVTIPKKLRDELGIRRNSKVLVWLEKGGKISMRPARTILDIAGSFRVVKPKNAVSLRKEMEKRYTR